MIWDNELNCIKLWINELNCWAHSLSPRNWTVTRLMRRKMVDWRARRWYNRSKFFNSRRPEGRRRACVRRRVVLTASHRAGVVISKSALWLRNWLRWLVYYAQAVVSLTHWLYRVVIPVILFFSSIFEKKLHVWIVGRVQQVVSFLKNLVNKGRKLRRLDSNWIWFHFFCFWESRGCSPL